MKDRKIVDSIYGKLNSKFKSLIRDEQGSVLPLIAVILILVILIGAANFSLVVMYRDRAIVRNAIDAGVTSSLASVAKEKKQYINYGEELITTETATVDCEEAVPDGEDEDGNTTYTYVPYSYSVPRVQRWVDTESGLKNYVQLNVSSANSVAKNYFNKNMDGNNINFNTISWNYEVTYDTARKYTVKKDRDVLRPDVSGSPPSWCNSGSPDIYNEVTTPDSWWGGDFAGANTPGWTSPPSWTLDASEEREVIFPRWVEVKATVTVELPVPFGNLLGRSTYKANFDVTVVKELVNAIP